MHVKLIEDDLKATMESISKCANRIEKKKLLLRYKALADALRRLDFKGNNLENGKD